jgi:hypothetical protein
MAVKTKEGKMAYRPDVYREENIVGHTGRLGYLPTVYFEKGMEFGRITQTHKKQCNIGRNKVRDLRFYVRTNDPSLREQYEDTDGRGFHHTSRSKFVSCTAGPSSAKDRMGLSIVLFQELKAKDLTDDASWQGLLCKPNVCHVPRT